MANITYVDPNLSELTAGNVAADDVMTVWDTSAGQLKKATRKSAVGANITGDKNFAIPADGIAAMLDVAQAFQAPFSVPAAATNGGTTIADDAVISFTPNPVLPVGASVYAGMLLIWGRAANNSNVAAVIAFRCGTGAGWATLVAQPAAAIIATATTALTGTTGTDGKLTVAAVSDGKIYIENRLGFAVSVGYLVLG